jgi:X-X-X-Leu-X-X-Gly heptad repeat protein
VHYHHRHDDPCDDDHDWADPWLALFATLNRMETTMTEAQQHLDTDVQALTDGFSQLADGVGQLTGEVDALKAAAQAQGVSLDFSKADALVPQVNALVARVQAALPAPAPAPAEPTPAPVVDPSAPAPAAPVDGSGPGVPHARNPPAAHRHPSRRRTGRHLRPLRTGGHRVGRQRS